MGEELKQKYSELFEIIKGTQKLAVAFSGGVDSALLLYAAKEALGDAVVAITVFTQSYPQHEVADAEKFLKQYGVKQLKINLDQLSIDGFRKNEADRCYHCKKALLASIIELAAGEGIGVVADGSNTDDDGDYRPGMRAIKELGVISPLKMAGLSKADIRELSKEFGLFTWDKPSYACLASRVPYGEEITTEKLVMIEQAEHILHGRGLKNVRVRHYGALAKIEVSQGDWMKVVVERQVLAEDFRAIGFTHTAIDLEPFASGSMNKDIAKKKE